MTRLRRPWLLALAGGGLLCAFRLQEWAEGWNVAYFGLLGIGRNNLNIEGASAGTVALGACDLFMYQGGRSLHGFLAFLLLYAGWVGLGWLLLAFVPDRRRSQVLLGWSLLFLAMALEPDGAARLVELVLGLFLVSSLPLAGRVRGGLLMALMALWLPSEGRALLGAAEGAWFQAGLPEADLSFPRLFVALALLVKTSRRVLWVAFESSQGRAEDPELVDFLLYFLGLPFLMGNAVTPPFQGFRESRGRGPGPEEGAATLAWCLGLVPILLTLAVMAAYSPAVVLFFPHCDLNHVVGFAIWTRYLVTYPVEFMFLLATEQASVGVARLFGYGLKDNYSQPMLAPDPASFWRRWNIYWRDFLVAAFFFPVALALARKEGRRTPRHVAIAAGVTFLATWFLNLAPLALLGGFSERTLQWTALVPSLALYYGVEGLAVALVLVHEARRSPGARRLPPWLGILGTFLFIAAARGFLNPQFSAAEHLQLLLRAVGVDLRL